ncbi:hypothetical protein IP84_06215 [beta proteobacterium AAP99]|nr:hypothetical protein IP84_06215 [beta proteobacterium AAP99]
MLVACAAQAQSAVQPPAASAAAAAGTPTAAPAPAQSAPRPASGSDLAACQALVQRLSAFKPVDCARLAFLPSGHQSVRGRPILVREFGAPVASPRPSAAPGADRPPGAVLRRPRVLLVGGIHGDELTSTATVLRWAEWLARDAAAGQPVPFHWRVVPAMNPDGLLARPATRVNANGVDLNRNFPTPGWEPKARKWWEGTARKDPRRFPGRTAASEPETRWLLAEMERFAPDVIISVHAPFGLLDYDGPKPQNLSPPRQLGRLYLDQLGVYPGSLGNYGGVHRGVAVLTIELPHALELPNDLELARMWTDLRRWIAEYMQRSAAAQLAAGGGSGVDGGSASPRP